MNKSESYDTPSFVENTCNRKNSVSIDNNGAKIDYQLIGANCHEFPV